MSDVLQWEQLTGETQALLQKAAQTAGITSLTGATGIDLSGFTSLVPVNTPARNNTSAFPRAIAGMGSSIAQWKTWLNINSAQITAAVGADYAGSPTQFQEQDVFAPYKILAKFGRATLDAVAFARNYVDQMAQAELQTLNQLWIAQDMNIINSQNWLLGTPTVATLSSATTGGSIPLSTAVYVRVAVRSGANYFDGGSSLGSAAVTLTTGSGTSTNTVTATVSGGAVKGAVAYDWYVGGSATTTAQYYYGTTTTTSVVITQIPSAAPTTVFGATTGAVGNVVANLPLLSTLLPGHGINPFPNTLGVATAGNGAVPLASLSPADTDLSGNANYYNGVIASTLGDYGTSTGPVVAPGSGTATGATFIDNGGAAPAVSSAGVDILDKINDALWASVPLSPTAYMMNSLQGNEVSKAVLGSSSATTFLPPTDADARTNLAAGGFVGRYVNRAAGGVPVMIEIHPRVPPGTIIARTNRVPFPGSNIGTAFEVRCQYDTMRFDYAANWSPGVAGGGPRYDFDIRSNETLINYAPVAQAIVENVG